MQQTKICRIHQGLPLAQLAHLALLCLSVPEAVEKLHWTTSAVCQQPLAHQYNARFPIHQIGREAPFKRIFEPLRTLIPKYQKALLRVEHSDIKFAN
jgi:hypothetical protein